MFLLIDRHGLLQHRMVVAPLYRALMVGVFVPLTREQQLYPTFSLSSWRLTGTKALAFIPCWICIASLPPGLMVRLLSLFAFAFVDLVYAAVVRVKRQDITTLSSTQIAGFAPFTHLASAAYCDPSLTKNWDCGGAFTHCSHPLSMP